MNDVHYVHVNAQHSESAKGLENASLYYTLHITNTLNMKSTEEPIYSKAGEKKSVSNLAMLTQVCNEQMSQCDKRKEES